MLNIKDRLSELDVLLDNLDNDDWLKIPEDILIGIKENKNKDYDWHYDSSIPFENQEINSDTLILFLLLMYRYIADSEEKKEINKILKENSDKNNNKFDTNNIFIKNNEEYILNNEETNETKSYNKETLETNNSENLLVEYKESIFTKIKNYIVRFLKKD